jgi:hypothetical protein
MTIPKTAFKLLTILTLSQIFAFASTITLTDTINPANGAACSPATNGPGVNASVPPANGFTGACIDGAPIQFDMFKVSLTSPTTSGGNWKLEILTNYGPVGSGTNFIPGGSTSIPSYAYQGGSFGIADFMIKSGSNFYGVVMTPHDGYTAGSLYQASGFQTSFQVMNAPLVTEIPRPTLPALLNAGGTKIGNGSLLAGPNGGDGITAALYKISVEFAAPVNFLSSGTFTIYAASYVCDNGYMTGVFDAFAPPPTGGTPPPSNIPEPATWTLLIPAAVLIGLRRFPKRS